MSCLMKFDVKDSRLFNVYLGSAGQVQGFDTHMNSNEQLENQPWNNRKT